MGWIAPRRSLADRLAPSRPAEDHGLELQDGSRIAVIGGGPAGSLFTYFAFKMSDVVGLELQVDLFEPRRFAHCGPAGCNHCGGIVSESLVQLLATEGITLPASVIQRGIESYELHMDVGSVRIDTPLREKRIAAVFRGNGPRDVESSSWGSFDRFLLELAQSKGARLVRRAVTGVQWDDGRPVIEHAGESGASYDLVVVAAGINSRLLSVLQQGPLDYTRPTTTAAYICEFELDRETIRTHLGHSMHVFLLDLPRLEFAALIPKETIVTLCLLGEGIDLDLVREFLSAPEVVSCFPPATELPARVCNCSPLLNVGGPARPYGDRVVFVGDSGVTRLYKDGIGAAYRTAKAAAATAVFQGVSSAAFERHYRPICRRISRDNAIGKLIFGFNGQLQKRRFSRRAVHRMVDREQSGSGSARHLSQVLWDLFTGSAPYREILLRTVHPGFVAGLVWNVIHSIPPFTGGTLVERGAHGPEGTR
jgi:flavin-dependent dehydrogenase